jgi:ABC-type multidrug transport system fused ATPase/permease subunit
MNQSNLKQILKTYSRINTEQRILNYTIYNDTDGDSYQDSMRHRQQMIYLFPIISVTVALMSFLRPLIFYLLARKASMSLHGLLFERIVNASLEFFSSHYIANMLNRFSEDLLYVDGRVPYSMYLVLEVRTYKMLFLLKWI